jgi:hypothetical protein
MAVCLMLHTLNLYHRLGDSPTPPARARCAALPMLCVPSIGALAAWALRDAWALPQPSTSSESRMSTMDRRNSSSECSQPLGGVVCVCVYVCVWGTCWCWRDLSYPRRLRVCLSACGSEAHALPRDDFQSSHPVLLPTPPRPPSLSHSEEPASLSMSSGSITSRARCTSVHSSSPAPPIRETVQSPRDVTAMSTHAPAPPVGAVPSFLFPAGTRAIPQSTVLAPGSPAGSCAKPRCPDCTNAPSDATCPSRRALSLPVARGRGAGAGAHHSARALGGRALPRVARDVAVERKEVCGPGVRRARDHVRPRAAPRPAPCLSTTPALAAGGRCRRAGAVLRT